MNEPGPLSVTAPRCAGAWSTRRLFAVVGGPAAWYVQLCAGDWLASGPCFPGTQRLQSPAHGLVWTGSAALGLLIACALIALAAFFAAAGIYRKTKPGGATSVGPEDSVTGRIRFMAFWGMFLGAGFCVATLLTVVAFATLPRCAG
jgi:hypothetical protein